MEKIYYPGPERLDASALAFGCMTLGGSWDDSPLTEEVYRKAERAVLTAVEQGFTLFDHSDVYCLGKSEQVFGKILQEHPGLRRKMLIQTKCGIRLEDPLVPGIPEHYDSSDPHIIDSVHASLGRLQIDSIDILLLHRLDALMEPDEVARAFGHLQANGKVRYFGVSNHSWAQMKRLQASLDQRLIVNQLRLSLGHPHLIRNSFAFNEKGLGNSGETLDEASLQQIQVQAYGALDQGRWAAPTNDSQVSSSEVAGLILRMAEERDVPPETIPLAWLMRHPAGIQPVIGTTHPDRIRACARVHEVKLSRREWYALLVAAWGQLP